MASGSYFATIDEFQVLSVFRPKINKANREYFREWWFSIGSVKSLIKKNKTSGSRVEDDKGHVKIMWNV